MDGRGVPLYDGLHLHERMAVDNVWILHGSYMGASTSSLFVPLSWDVDKKEEEPAIID